MIQRTSRGTEKERSKTSRSGESQEVGSRKNIEQKKSKRTYKILGEIEGFYSGT